MLWDEDWKISKILKSFVISFAITLLAFIPDWLELRWCVMKVHECLPSPAVPSQPFIGTFIIWFSAFHHSSWLLSKFSLVLSSIPKCTAWSLWGIPTYLFEIIFNSISQITDVHYTSFKVKLLLNFLITSLPNASKWTIRYRGLQILKILIFQHPPLSSLTKYLNKFALYRVFPPTRKFDRPNWTCRSYCALSHR